MTGLLALFHFFFLCPCFKNHYYCSKFDVHWLLLACSLVSDFVDLRKIVFHSFCSLVLCFTLTLYDLKKKILCPPLAPPASSFYPLNSPPPPPPHPPPAATFLFFFPHLYSPLPFTCKLPPSPDFDFPSFLYSLSIFLLFLLPAISPPFPPPS